MCESAHVILQYQWDARPVMGCITPETRGLIHKAGGGEGKNGQRTYDSNFAFTRCNSVRTKLG